MQRYYIYIMFFLLFAFQSCTKIPTSSGRAYELLVVADDDFWNVSPGKALSAVLSKEIPGLPVYEKSFKVMKSTPTHFDQTLKMVRNIVVVHIGSSFKKSRLFFERDVYAYPQRIMTIEAPDNAAFAKIVSKQSQVIIDFFTNFEINCQIAFLKKKHSEEVSQVVDSMFGCKIWLPVELHDLKRGVDFLWASTNTSDVNQNFLMYVYSYSDKKPFTKAKFVAKRDSVMQRNLKGEIKGDYMTVDTLNIQACRKKIKNTDVFEVRGLWKMKKDIMGGPFVSYVYIDKLHKRVYNAEIFVYSPDKMKGNLMRTFEASFYTLRFPVKTKTSSVY